MDAFAHTMAKKIHDADADVATSCLPPLMYSFAKLQMPGLVEFTNTFKVRVIAFPISSRRQPQRFAEQLWRVLTHKLESLNPTPRCKSERLLDSRPRAVVECLCGQVPPRGFNHLRHGAGGSCLVIRAAALVSFHELGRLVSFHEC